MSQVWLYQDIPGYVTGWVIPGYLCISRDLAGCCFSRWMARSVHMAAPAATARPDAVPGRIIGGRELPTSSLTTD